MLHERHIFWLVDLDLACPELEWQDVAMEHDVNHVHQLDLLVRQKLYFLLQLCHLLRVALVQAFPLPVNDPTRRVRLEGWDLCMDANEGFREIKPLMLPFLNCFHKGAL